MKRRRCLFFSPTRMALHFRTYGDRSRDFNCFLALRAPCLSHRGVVKSSPSVIAQALAQEKMEEIRTKPYMELFVSEEPNPDSKEVQACL